MISPTDDMYIPKSIGPRTDRALRYAGSTRKHSCLLGSDGDLLSELSNEGPESF